MLARRTPDLREQSLLYYTYADMYGGEQMTLPLLVTLTLPIAIGLFLTEWLFSGRARPRRSTRR